MDSLRTVAPHTQVYAAYYLVQVSYCHSLNHELSSLYNSVNLNLNDTFVIALFHLRHITAKLPLIKIDKLDLNEEEEGQVFFPLGSSSPEVI